MRPRDHARRKARKMQERGIPWHIARVTAGQRVARRNPHLRSKASDNKR